MSTTISGKCIQDLCTIQAKSAKAGHWLENQMITDKVFGTLNESANFSLSIDLLDSKQSIIKILSSLLLLEEAYELVESSALNFSVVFQFHDLGNNYKYLVGLAYHCGHYDGASVRIHSAEHNLETLGYFTAVHRDNLIIDSRWAEKNSRRLTGMRAICKVVEDDALVSSGKRGLDLLKRVLDKADENDGSNSSVVGAMFNLLRQDLGETQEIELSVPYIGDSFGREAIVKAIAAKSRLKARRPFIVRNSVWTYEFAWLDCLVANITAIHGAKTGILCPSWRTRLEIEERLKDHQSVPVHLSSTVKTKSELDYLIVYQAHSVGVTEAIEWMNEVKPDGCIVLVGDPFMPNLRVRNLQVRAACASILNWFYDRDRYPEYFEHDSPYIAHNRVCLDYDPVIFEFFNQTFYNGELINPAELDAAPIKNPLTIKRVKGSTVMQGCSPYNCAEISYWMQSIRKLVRSGISQHRIGVLTNSCAQKKQIMGRCKHSFKNVFVGTLQDFEYTIRDHLIITIVETAERTFGGRRYLFSDLLYDKLCLNLALTRGPNQIIIIGDSDVLREIDHWKQLLDLCDSSKR